MKKFFKEAFLDFIKAEIILSYRARLSILIYIGLFIVFAFIQHIMSPAEPWKVHILLTIGMLLMPVIIYFGLSFKDFATRVAKGQKEQKEKRSFREKLINFSHLMILVSIYAWLAILLIIALLRLFTD